MSGSSLASLAKFMLTFKLTCSMVEQMTRCEFHFSCRAVAFNRSFTSVMNQELSIKLIRELEKAQESQRALSKHCGVSLGSVHYCLNSLIEKGYVKAKNFKNAQNKLAYAYILTPSGINLKKELAVKFCGASKLNMRRFKKK